MDEVKLELEHLLQYAMLGYPDHLEKFKTLLEGREDKDLWIKLWDEKAPSRSKIG